MRLAAVPCFFCLLAAPALADPPEVLGAEYAPGRISVTLAHGDTGWEDYADAWEVLDMEGTRLALRELAHPHVEEQPFTRSTTLDLPGTGPWQVQVRARTNLGEWSEPVTLTLN